MSVLKPRIVYLCDECGEYSYEAGKCPYDEGKLTKICDFCGNNFDECKCTQEELASRCEKCGFAKTLCKCRA